MNKIHDIQKFEHLLRLKKTQREHIHDRLREEDKRLDFIQDEIKRLESILYKLKESYATCES